MYMDPHHDFTWEEKVPLQRITKKNHPRCPTLSLTLQLSRQTSPREGSHPGPQSQVQARHGPGGMQALSICCAEMRRFRPLPGAQIACHLSPLVTCPMSWATGLSLKCSENFMSNGVGEERGRVSNELSTLLFSSKARGQERTGMMHPVNGSKGHIRDPS